MSRPTSTDLVYSTKGAVELSIAMRRILPSWSSGKDSAWSLHILRQRGEYEVAGLLTTFNEAAGRVAMHAVRRELVEQQAAATGLPLWKLLLPWPCSNEQYESLMAETCARAVAAGIEDIAFGDLFLGDVRTYREKQMRHTGLQPIFPLWGQGSHQRPVLAFPYFCGNHVHLHFVGNARHGDQQRPFFEQWHEFDKH